MKVMPRQFSVKIRFLKRLRPDVFLLGFNSDYLAKNAEAGQFVHIKIDEKITILRRPFSIHKISGNTIYILFRARGRGTRLLSQLQNGAALDIIGPLGNGFKISPQPTVNVVKRSPPAGGHSPQTNILVAGGMGVAPLIFLVQRLKQTTNYKLQTTILLGAKNKNEVLAEQEFKKLGFDARIATDDGSRGFKGSVIGLLKKTLSTMDCRLSTNIYACGPKEMFYEINKVIKPYRNINCQVSFEQFMGCGLGVCYGCSIETKQGYKKLCKDGPVFDIKEVK
jgi:dihydroorotate dehydrogenase electron transfer subunit